MIIEFPKSLYTEEDRREDRLISLLNMLATEFKRLNIPLNQHHLEYLAECLDEVINGEDYGLERP